MELRKSNALQFLEDKTSDYAERVALGIKTQLGWNEFTYSGLGMLSRKVGHYLINELQIPKGEKLAILSESMPEYGACVFGSVLAGLVTVPLDIKFTEYELQSILSDCEPTILMVSKALVDSADGFNFKWADNYIENDVNSFYTKGDAAPYGRLCYRY